MISVLIVFHAANKKRESNKNTFKTRQQLDRDKTVLLVAT